jgi:hypothetical protein
MTDSQLDNLIHLFIYRYKTGIDLNCTFGFHKRALRAGTVDLIAFPEILHDRFQPDHFSFLKKLLLTPRGTNVNVGSEKQFEFRIGKDNGADIPAVHHNTPVFAQSSLLFNHR